MVLTTDSKTNTGNLSDKIYDIFMLIETIKFITNLFSKLFVPVTTVIINELPVVSRLPVLSVM